jgi:protein-histidine pros-kinase
MARLFNESELLERVDNDLAFLIDTVGMLQTDGRGLVAEVKLGINASNAPAVGRAAHTLKGMISNFCAPAVHSLAFDVERAGKAGDCSAAAASLPRLEQSLDELIAELAAFVKARAACAS